jgi:hypothetical protein
VDLFQRFCVAPDAFGGGTATLVSSQIDRAYVLVLEDMLVSHHRPYTMPVARETVLRLAGLVSQVSATVTSALLRVGLRSCDSVLLGHALVYLCQQAESVPDVALVSRACRELHYSKQLDSAALSAARLVRIRFLAGWSGRGSCFGVGAQVLQVSVAAIMVDAVTAVGRSDLAALFVAQLSPTIRTGLDGAVHTCRA